VHQSVDRGAPGAGHEPCGAKTRGGGTCKLRAGQGTDHLGVGRCKLHGGSTPNHVAAARRQQAEQAVATYGLPREVEPHDALLEELWRTAGHVSWLATKIAELEESGLKQYAPAGTYQSVVDGIDRALVWERPSVWLELYERERKHLAAVAKTCVDVGVEERRVQLAEQHGALLARVIDGIAADLGVKDDPRFPAVVRRHLTLVQPAA
jgi:hypothetical protein